MPAHNTHVIDSQCGRGRVLSLVSSELGSDGELVRLSRPTRRRQRREHPCCHHRQEATALGILRGDLGGENGRARLALPVVRHHGDVAASLEHHVLVDVICPPRVWLQKIGVRYFLKRKTGGEGHMGASQQWTRLRASEQLHGMPGHTATLSGGGVCEEELRVISIATAADAFRIL